MIEGAKWADSARAAAEGAEALIVATEWHEFAAADLATLKEKMHTPLMFDGRNLFDPATVRGHGFTYHSIGRA
jgi:UDPglucose 6-dehydrogenase